VKIAIAQLIVQVLIVSAAKTSAKETKNIETSAFRF